MMKLIGTQLAALILLGLIYNPTYAEVMDNYQIHPNSNPEDRINIIYPSWFKQSFLDLKEDLKEAHAAGKRGIIVMFSQESCSHCKAFIQATLNNPAVNNRVRAKYDVIGLEIFSDLEITDIDGSVAPIAKYAEKHRALLTPTLLFYGVENTRLLRIMGFYPPEKFQQVLDYIDGGHHRKTRLSEYLRVTHARATATKHEITQDPALFGNPPYKLRPDGNTVKRPILVLFESPNCSACKRFHQRVLSNPDIRKTITRFHAVQLNSSDDTTTLTLPDGRQLTAKKWSDELQLNYDISVLFFNEQGQEVFRNDAETAANRMAFTMEYVLAKGYETEKQVNRWRRENMLNQISTNN